MYLRANEPVLRAFLPGKPLGWPQSRGDLMRQVRSQSFG